MLKPTGRPVAKQVANQVSCDLCQAVKLTKLVSQCLTAEPTQAPWSLGWSQQCARPCVPRGRSEEGLWEGYHGIHDSVRSYVRARLSLVIDRYILPYPSILISPDVPFFLWRPTTFMQFNTTNQISNIFKQSLFLHFISTCFAKKTYLFHLLFPLATAPGGYWTVATRSLWPSTTSGFASLEIGAAPGEQKRGLRCVVLTRHFFWLIRVPLRFTAIIINHWEIVTKKQCKQIEGHVWAVWKYWDTYNLKMVEGLEVGVFKWRGNGRWYKFEYWSWRGAFHIVSALLHMSYVGAVLRKSPKSRRKAQPCQGWKTRDLFLVAWVPGRYNDYPPSLLESPIVMRVMLQCKMIQAFVRSSLGGFFPHPFFNFKTWEEE